MNGFGKLALLSGAILIGLGALEAHAAESELQRAYRRSKVLVIGTSNHLSRQADQRILEFLDTLGTDPNLKFIGLERPYQLEETYRTLSSLWPITPEKLVAKALSREQLREGFCGLQREWPWMDHELLPRIARINHSRQTSTPLTVVPIDGLTLQDGRRYRELRDSERPGASVSRGNCSYIQFRNEKFTDRTVDPLTTGDRERATAENFRKMLWSRLGPQDKAIVIYHFGHVLRGFESCHANRTDRGWISRWQPTAWIDHFLRAEPGAAEAIRVVLFDENIEKQNPSGVLAKNAKHSKGLEIFQPDAFIRSSYLGGQHRSQSPFASVFDEVVRLDPPKADAGFPAPDRSWPEMCRP